MCLRPPSPGGNRGLYPSLPPLRRPVRVGPQEGGRDAGAVAPIPSAPAVPRNLRRSLSHRGGDPDGDLLHLRVHPGSFWGGSSNRHFSLGPLSLDLVGLPIRIHLPLELLRALRPGPQLCHSPLDPRYRCPSDRRLGTYRGNPSRCALVFDRLQPHPTAPPAAVSALSSAHWSPRYHERSHRGCVPPPHSDADCRRPCELLRRGPSNSRALELSQR